MKPKPPIEKIAEAKTLAEIIAQIDALERESRLVDNLAARRSLLGQRRRLERRAGQIILADGPPDHLKSYQLERYRRFARMSDDEFNQKLAYGMARLRLNAGAPGTMSPAIKMIQSPWRRDEFGNLSRTLQAADPAPAASQVQASGPGGR